jgi:hypothetical protein
MSLECPYCEKEIKDPDECYEQCVDYEHECPHCEKMFVFQVEYTRDYSAYKADCLNDGEHRYKEQKRYGSGEPEIFSRCQDCGHEVHNSAQTE